jgi:hypothetical protein
MMIDGFSHEALQAMGPDGVRVEKLKKIIAKIRGVVHEQA